MPFPLPELDFIENQQTAGGFVLLTLFDEPGLGVDDYTWMARYLNNSGESSHRAISTVVLVKGGSPAPTVRSHTGGSSSGSLTVAVTKPAGTTAGDLLITWAAHASTSTGMGAPSGWTPIFSQGGTSEQLRTWARIADGSEGASFTWSSSASLTNWSWACACIQNPHGTATTAIDDWYSANDPTQFDHFAGPVTSTVDGALGLPCFVLDPEGGFADEHFGCQIATGTIQPVYFVQAQLV